LSHQKFELGTHFTQHDITNAIQIREFTVKKARKVWNEKESRKYKQLYIFLYRFSCF